MGVAHMMKNTDKTYLCVQCGSQDTNIIREAKVLEEIKLKCNTCTFIFTASDSVKAEEANAIPDGPPPVPKVDRGIKPREHLVDEAKRENLSTHIVEQRTNIAPSIKIARNVSYVIISKTRDETEFVSQKGLKKAVLNWEAREKNFDVYQLTPKKVEAKVHIEE